MTTQEIMVNILAKHVMGAFAKWAIQQSPYVLPGGLEQALKDLNAATRDRFAISQLTSGKPIFYDSMQVFLRQFVSEHPACQRWCKFQEDEVPVVAASVFSRAEGVNLDALVDNMLKELICSGDIDHAVTLFTPER